jgi:hypothetical protein
MQLQELPHAKLEKLVTASLGLTMGCPLQQTLHREHLFSYCDGSSSIDRLQGCFISSFDLFVALPSCECI